MSQLSVETYWFADGLCYSSNHGVLCTIGISMARFQKSVGQSICNAKKAYSYFIVDSRIIIRISGESLGILYKKLKQY